MMPPDDLFNKRKEIGDRLKAKRTKKGLSVLHISNITGMNRSTIHKIEAGKGGVRLDVLIIYQNALKRTK